MKNKIYKARVIHDVVVQADTQDEAYRAIQSKCKIEGMPIQIEYLTQVHSLAELPFGWTGYELAFSEKPIPTHQEQPIGWHLKNEQ